MSKFKIGDKVRILLSASKDGIHEGDLGREAIVEVNKNYATMYIRMVLPRSHNSGGWWVDGDHIIPIIKIGEQLVFSFMRD